MVRPNMKNRIRAAWVAAALGLFAIQAWDLHYNESQYADKQQHGRSNQLQ